MQRILVTFLLCLSLNGLVALSKAQTDALQIDVEDFQAALDADNGDTSNSEESLCLLQVNQRIDRKGSSERPVPAELSEVNPELQNEYEERTHHQPVDFMGMATESDRGAVERLQNVASRLEALKAANEATPVELFDAKDNIADLEARKAALELKKQALGAKIRAASALESQDREVYDATPAAEVVKTTSADLPAELAKFEGLAANRAQSGTTDPKSERDVKKMVQDMEAQVQDLENTMAQTKKMSVDSEQEYSQGLSSKAKEKRFTEPSDSYVDPDPDPEPSGSNSHPQVMTEHAQSFVLSRQPEETPSGLETASEDKQKQVDDSPASQDPDASSQKELKYKPVQFVPIPDEPDPVAVEEARDWTKKDEDEAPEEHYDPVTRKTAITSFSEVAQSQSTANMERSTSTSFRK